MDLRFTTPDLRALDQLGTEILVCGLASDEQPPQGVAGLVDWRLAGKISRLMIDGFATGQLGEKLLIGGKPKLPFDKVVLFGLGKKAEFEEALYRSVIQLVLSTLEGLRARAAVVELPGRHFGALPPERAADILLESVGSSREHDVWTLIEPVDAQRSITQRMIQERRRVRHI
ncbi:MAG TPA: M17 family peptidase N-terminal domain-containing protein [Polyangiaceae bacterium]|jgi:hypothetical protein|nr:M17 family peptidase N-terminal domain-containing protein [Polyangiaceae bacterium]